MRHYWSIFRNLSPREGVVYDSRTDGARYRMKVTRGKNVASAVRSLVNARSLNMTVQGSAKRVDVAECTESRLVS